MSDHVKQPPDKNLHKRMLPSRANNEYAINDDGYAESEEQQEIQLIDDKNLSNENSDDGLISPKKKVRKSFNPTTSSP